MNDPSPARTSTNASPSDFFKPGSVATLSGSAAAVIVVTNVVDSLDPAPIAWWVPLALSFVVAIAAYQFAVSPQDSGFADTPRFARWVLVALNAFLIYASAFGVQGAALSETDETTGRPKMAWQSPRAPFKRPPRKTHRSDQQPQPQPQPPLR